MAFSMEAIRDFREWANMVKGIPTPVDRQEEAKVNQINTQTQIARRKAAADERKAAYDNYMKQQEFALKRLDANNKLKDADFKRRAELSKLFQSERMNKANIVNNQTRMKLEAIKEEQSQIDKARDRMLQAKLGNQQSQQQPIRIGNAGAMS